MLMICFALACKILGIKYGSFVRDTLPVVFFCDAVFIVLTLPLLAMYFGLLQL